MGKPGRIYLLADEVAVNKVAQAAGAGLAPLDAGIPFQVL